MNSEDSHAALRAVLRAALFFGRFPERDHVRESVRDLGQRANVTMPVQLPDKAAPIVVAELRSDHAAGLDCRVAGSLRSG